MDGCGRGLWVQFLFGVRWCQASAADQGGLGTVVGMGSVVYESYPARDVHNACVCRNWPFGILVHLVLLHYCCSCILPLIPKKIISTFQLRCLCVI
jgi:hypothetical protein